MNNLANFISTNFHFQIDLLICQILLSTNFILII